MTSASSSAGSSAVAPAELREDRDAAHPEVVVDGSTRAPARPSARGRRRAGPPARCASSSVIVPPLPGPHHVLDHRDDVGILACRRARRAAPSPRSAPRGGIASSHSSSAAARSVRGILLASGERCARCGAPRAPRTPRNGMADFMYACCPGARAGSAAARSARRMSSGIGSRGIRRSVHVAHDSSR